MAVPYRSSCHYCTDPDALSDLLAFVADAQDNSWTAPPQASRPPFAFAVPSKKTHDATH
jgi:hypothetical protein